MSETYSGVLHEGRIQWDGAAPSGGHQRVLVTILKDTAPRDRGARMAAALERIASSGGVQSITDPVAWQREQRGERPMPGRDL